MRNRAVGNARRAKHTVSSLAEGWYRYSLRILKTMHTTRNPPQEYLILHNVQWIPSTVLYTLW